MVTGAHCGTHLEPSWCEEKSADKGDIPGILDSNGNLIFFF